MSASREIHVLHIIDSLGYGGAEASLIAVAPQLIERGVDLRVAVFDGHTAHSDALAAGGIRVDSIAGRHRVDRIRNAQRLIRRTRPDVVHTSLFEAGLVGRLASIGSGARVVSSLVSTPYGPKGVRDPHVAAWKVRVAQLVDIGTARRVVRFHAVAEHVADTMARRLLVPRARIDVVYRGRDEAALGRSTPDRRARVRARFGYDETDRLLVAVGRHEYSKGLDVLISGVVRLTQAMQGVRVLIVGRRGSRTAALENEIRTRGLDAVVTLAGPRDDVPDVLSAADLFVLPSRWEGLPNALIEAIAIGIPVVATDLPGVREILADHEPLVAPGDPEGLADAMISALETRDDRAVDRHHQRFLDAFTVDAAAEGMCAFYERTLR